MAELPQVVATAGNQILHFGCQDWKLPVVASQKNANSLSSLMGQTPIKSHHNCNSFPATKIVESKTLEQLRKLSYNVYVQDFPIANCPKLQKFLQPILDQLQQLQPLGVWDLLRFLEEHFNPFKNNRRKYSYTNCFLYYGRKGTGTPHHWVTIWLSHSTAFSFEKPTSYLLFKQGHVGNARHQHRPPRFKRMDSNSRG